MIAEQYDPNSVQQVLPYGIIIKQDAVDQVKELIDSEYSDPDTKGLRVFVQGGGCSGFQYGFAFENNINEDDVQLEQDGVLFLVDSLSIQYLMGSTIDYKQNIYGSQFTIENPNATTTCGCGQSFDI